jgi:hypothetical protein
MKRLILLYIIGSVSQPYSLIRATTRESVTHQTAIGCDACHQRHTVAQVRRQSIAAQMLCMDEAQAVKSIAFVQQLFDTQATMHGGIPDNHQAAALLINGLRWISLYKYQQNPEKILWTQGSYLVIPQCSESSQAVLNQVLRYSWYRRLSSHVSTHTVGWPLGLDVPLGRNHQVIGKFYTILMHRLQGDRLFFKPEDHPTHPNRPWGMIKHGAQLINDIASRWGMGRLFRQDPIDAPWFSKEQIDLRIPELKLLVDTIKTHVPADDQKILLQDVAKTGLGPLVARIKNYLDTADPATSYELFRALEYVQDMTDHHEDRLCRETILYEQDVTVVPATLETVERLKQILQHMMTKDSELARDPQALCKQHIFHGRTLSYASHR